MKSYYSLLLATFISLSVRSQEPQSPKPGIAVNGSLCLIQNTVWSCVPVDCDSIVIMQGDSVEFCTYQEINLSTDTSYWLDWIFTGCGNFPDTVRDDYPTATPLCYWPRWDTAGVYNVKVRYNGWLSAYPTSDCYAEGPSEWKIKIVVIPNPNSVNDEDDETKLLLFPQPADDYINLNFENPGAFVVRNMYGVIIASGTNTSTVNVQDLNNGFYILEFTTEGGSVARSVFVVQHSVK